MVSFVLWSAYFTNSMLKAKQRIGNIRIGPSCQKQTAKMHIDSAIRKHTFGQMQTVKAQFSLHIHTDKGLQCLLTESVDTTECMNGEQKPG